MAADTRVEASSILIVKWGRYEDKGQSKPLRVLKTFDKVEVAKLYRQEYQLLISTLEDSWKYDEYSPTTGHFVAWLLLKAYVQEIPAHEWDVGDYYFSPKESPAKEE